MSGFSLKDDLFNAESVGWLARYFEDAGVFKAAPYVAEMLAVFPDLELKQRISAMADGLIKRLPEDFGGIAAGLRAGLPPKLDPSLTDDDFGRFVVAPLGEVVERKGLDHPDQALDLLEDITQRFSMEWSIRPFINAHPDLTLARLHLWTGHANYHVRRLVSEGTRPKLPWGKGIDLDPLVPLALLDRLAADPTRYVTRSVANHLNDISKISPEAVLDRLTIWQGGGQDPKELNWMTRHALRTLIKAGDRAAMEHLGYDPNPPVTVTELTLSPAMLPIGGSLEIAVELAARAPAKVILDLELGLLRSNGEMGRKVLKWKDISLKPGAPQRFIKTHRFKGDATTFRLYPGPQSLKVMANGQVLAEAPFTLT